MHHVPKVCVEIRRVIVDHFESHVRLYAVPARLRVNGPIIQLIPRARNDVFQRIQPVALLANKSRGIERLTSFVHFYILAVFIKTYLRKVHGDKPRVPIDRRRLHFEELAIHPLVVVRAGAARKITLPHGQLQFNTNHIIRIIRCSLGIITSKPHQTLHQISEPSHAITFDTGLSVVFVVGRPYHCLRPLHKQCVPVFVPGINIHGPRPKEGHVSILNLHHRIDKTSVARDIFRQVHPGCEHIPRVYRRGALET
mmetsp:Transcript_54910/g.80566  ORF Transcript_54910/g.80566 Transcript_54910/m.80566 type:complete len:254 (-) Transcript_54910:541-1302(-)